MALFVDGAISGLDDLAAQDSQLLDIATEEGINVTQKMALAQNEIGIELGSMLESLKLAGWPFSLVMEPSLGNIVVTPALQLWHAYRVLNMVYADAYSAQLNDRYAAKRDQFDQLASWAREKLIQTGLGICTDPVPQAATPVLSTASGNLPDGTYYATMAWVNQAGEEGGSSLPDAITTSGCTLVVRPGPPPDNVRGWNVYVGQATETMVMQNDRPIATSQDWQQSAILKTTGQTPGTGQAPAYMKSVPRVLQRG